MRLIYSIFLVFFSFLFPVLALGGVSEVVSAQKIRSFSALAAVHALIYYRSDQKSEDSRNLFAYQDAIKKLHYIVGADGDLHDFKPSIQKLDDVISKLETTQKTSQASYPPLLIELLDTDSDIRGIAQSRYSSSASDSSGAIIYLREISQGVSDLMVGNQARIARVVGEYSLTFDQSAAALVDKKINNNFGLLLKILPSKVDVLTKQSKRYRFVRGQLIGNEYKSSSGSTVFYLEKVLVDINLLTEDLAK